MFIKKRGLSLFLVLCLICTMFIGLPVPVNAALDLPTGNIYDADVLQNGSIAAVFINGGNVYYGVFNPATGSWTSEDIGAGKDAALALDTSGKPHVAYINSNDDLVYKYHDGTNWSSGETIDSISFGGIDGILSYPDIAVDGSGKAHIAYHDSKGGRDPSMDYSSYDIEDLVYATNATGTFVKTVRSYSHGWFYSPDGWRNWAMTPSKIALSAGNYYIGIKQYNYDKWMGGQYHTYNYNLLLPPADPSNDLAYLIRSASTNNDLGFKLYDMGSYGANVYSLFNKSGSLYITNGVTEVPGATKAFSTVGADLFVDGTGAIYYGAINSTNLLLYQNGAFKENLTLPASLHSTHTRIATVVSGDLQYVLYTDSTGKLRVHGVNTGADSAAPAWLEALPGTSDITTTGFSVNAGIDEPGMVYYTVVDRDATAPTPSEVRAGTNYGSVTKRASGNFPVLANIADNASVTGLSATTNYDVYFAAQDNEGNLQNEPTKIQITTASPSLEGAVTISGILKYNEILTADVTGVQGDASLQYQWRRDGNDIPEATNNTYTIVQDDISSTISVVVTAANYSGSFSDTTEITVAKADGPEAPTNGIVDDTDNTFDWTYVSGIETPGAYEYSVNGGTNWTGVSAKPVNVGDTAIAEGDLQVRVKATATHEAGSALASTGAFTVSDAMPVTFSDLDADHVYFAGDTLTFNIAGLDALNGQTVRVAFGVVGQTGTFTPAAVISGLTALNNGVQQFTTATVSGGSFSTNITGLIQNGLAGGMAAVQLYMDADGPGPGNVWINVLNGQPITYIPLTAESKPALTGVVIPAEITSIPVLGNGAQNSENLYNMDIAFQKEIADGITGKISFTGLDLIGNKEQLAQLSTGLTMLREATPGVGSLEEFTLGVDVANTLPFLADKGAVVSVTSPSFDGHTFADFIAAAEDVDGGEVSSLSFDDDTDTVTFTVNHFSYYTLSMADPDDANSDGYHDGDVAALAVFLEQPSDAVGKKNGEVLCDSGYDPLDPSTFSNVTWNAANPKRVTGIRWDVNYGYDAPCLAGNFDARPLSELTSLIINSTTTEHWHAGGNNGASITAINVAGLNKLETLDVHYNGITSLDLTGCTSLSILDVSENSLTGIDLSDCTSLTELNCGYNAIQNLDLTGISGITKLWCYSNQLSNLDVSAMAVLSSLDCQDNNLTNLDLSSNNVLTTLYCGENNLTSLDVSGKTALTDLDCYNSNLASLNVSGCTALTTLYCANNNLTSLNLSGVNELQNLYCQNNKLKFSDLPVSLPVSGGTHTYAPQQEVPITLTSGNVVDLSGEKMIDSANTTFTWYKSSDSSAISSGITENNGIFTFDRTTYADVSVYCVMTNAKFASFTGGDVLKTGQVTIQNLPSCDTPTPSISGTMVSWSAVTEAASYKLQIYLNDGITTVGDEITVPIDTTSYDLETITPPLAAGDYKVKVMAAGDGTTYENSHWSALSDVITIKNKVTIALPDGYTNPDVILNNENTGVFKFKISGQGISVNGDTNPTLKGKLTLAISNTVNCTFNSGDINAYTLARIDNDNVEASIKISSTATAGTTASFDVTVSIGNLSATHKVGTPSSVNVSDLSVSAPPQSTPPVAGNIIVTRTSATAVNISIANATDGHTYKVYAAESGGSNIGMVDIPMMGSTMTDVPVNSDVATIYITKQDSLNHSESARVAKVIDTFKTSLSPSGNQTFLTLAENYADGSQPTHTFVITNTGTAELSNVAVSISGTDSANFTITQPNATIAAGESATFTVKANNHLGVNTYHATITVSTANIPDKTFTVTQVVEVLHTVTFNSNGGSAVNAQMIEHNGVATAPTPPTKEGYVFAGWYIDEGLENQFNFSTPVTGNVTLYAKWVLGFTNDQKAAADKAALTWDIIKSTNILQNGVTANLNLIVTGTVYGSSISWTSSDTSILTVTGQVYRPAYNTGDKQVTLTAVITKGQASDTKEFILTVLKLSPSTNANLSGLTAEGITLTPGFSGETTSYSGSVGYGTNSSIITATADSTATVKINGTAGTSKAVDLSIGSNTITIEITAQDGTTKKTYTLTISRSSDGGGGGGGGSSTGTEPPTPVITTPSETGNTTTVSATLKAKTDETTGMSSATMDEALMDDLTIKARESEAAGQKAIVEIKVEAEAGAKTVEIEIPREAFNKVAAETKAKVQVDAGIGTITFSQKAVESISGAVNGGNISISVAKIEPSTLAKELQEKVGDRPVFDFSVQAGNTQISEFGGGNAEISIPYTPRAGEKANSIIVYYIDDSGKLNTVRGKYDPATGTVNFKTNHFSQYAVGYNEVRFNDVADTAWYKEAVNFAAARSITLGTGNGYFNPNDKLTRGQYIVMMMRAYGITPDENPADNFADGGNTYYTVYLATAKRLGIANGVGNNRFFPDREITRQEMFTLLYKALEKLDELPEGMTGKPLSNFRDADKIADYAKEAMTLFTETGIINGTGGMLNPVATSTRAQMAQVMYNLLSK